MPDITPLGITTPCLTDPVIPNTFFTYALTVENALATTISPATQALVRPSVVVNNNNGTAYTAGVAMTPAYNNEVYDNDNMFTPGGTSFTVNTFGTWVIMFQIQANLNSTNTAMLGEILINGVVQGSYKGAPAIAAAQPPNPVTAWTMGIPLSPGDTISSRITVFGVGNGSVFPNLRATLISYGA